MKMYDVRNSSKHLMANQDAKSSLPSHKNISLNFTVYAKVLAGRCKTVE